MKKRSKIHRQRRRVLWGVLGLATTAVTSRAFLFGPKSIEAVTFSVEPGEFYLPLGEAAAALGWSLRRDEATGDLFRDRNRISPITRRSLVDGTDLVSARDLAVAGATVTCKPTGGSIAVDGGWRSFVLERAEKRVEVNLTRQQLRAWQGDRLVLQTKVSTGRNGSTPAGEFRAGPFKSRLHYSSRYNNAPMPWSVQVNGHVFIHGFASVPDYPASHGCIRVPLTGANPARFFYEWVDTGVPVRILRDSTTP